MKDYVKDYCKDSSDQGPYVKDSVQDSCKDSLYQGPPQAPNNLDQGPLQAPKIVFFSLPA